MEGPWKMLRDEGYLEIPGFRIELTLDNTFMEFEYIPRVIVYDEKTGRWHMLRNPIPKGETLEENWDNALHLLREIAEGKVEPLFGDEDTSRRFSAALTKFVRGLR